MKLLLKLLDIHESTRRSDLLLLLFVLNITLIKRKSLMHKYVEMLFYSDVICGTGI